MGVLAVSIEPEILALLGGIFLTLVGLVGYAIVRTNRNTNLEVDLADILKQYQKALEQLGECNQVKADLLTIQEENRELWGKIEALEAETDRIERVRNENRALKGMLTTLRERVTKLEDYLTDRGLEIPNGSEDE